ncbi:MAG: hypothetical protein ACXV5I_04780 [Halobacteriota archaeon]
MYDDDVDAVIMAAEENPEYQEEIVEGFIDQVLRRKKRRRVAWRNIALLLSVGILGTLFIDRLISFPLSLFAFIFLWLVIFGAWAVTRFIALVKRNAMRLALMWLLTQAALRRTVSQGMRGSFTVGLVKACLKVLVKRFLIVTP